MNDRAIPHSWLVLLRLAAVGGLTMWLVDYPISWLLPSHPAVPGWSKAIQIVLSVAALIFGSSSLGGLAMCRLFAGAYCDASVKCGALIRVGQDLGIVVGIGLAVGFHI